MLCGCAHLTRCAAVMRLRTWPSEDGSRIAFGDAATRLRSPLLCFALPAGVARQATWMWGVGVGWKVGAARAGPASPLLALDPVRSSSRPEWRRLRSMVVRTVVKTLAVFGPWWYSRPGGWHADLWNGQKLRSVVPYARHAWAFPIVRTALCPPGRDGTAGWLKYTGRVAARAEPTATASAD